MKKYLILLVLAVNLSCKAQLTIPMNTDYSNYMKNNNHIKDVNGDLNKFIGFWKWTDPTNLNTYFEINLIKIDDWNPNNKNRYYIDKIIGNYRYVNNGVIISNTYNNNIYDLNSPLFPNILSNSFSPAFDELLINMEDIIKNKTCKAKFKIIDVNSTTLTASWEMRDYEGWSPTPLEPGFSVPSNIILVKQ